MSNVNCNNEKKYMKNIKTHKIEGGSLFNELHPPQGEGLELLLLFLVC